MQLLDGKLLSETIKAELKIKVDRIKTDGGKVPHLAAVLVGNNPASEAYVGNKIRSCEQIGFKSTLIRRDGSVTQAEILAIVNMFRQRQLNDETVNVGVVVHVIDNSQNFGLRYTAIAANERRFKPDLLARTDFIAHISLARRIVTNQNGCQMRHFSAVHFDAVNLNFEFGFDSFGE